MTKAAPRKKTIKQEDNDLFLKTVIDAMDEKKAKGIVSLNLSKIDNSICQYFVLCNADSTTQVMAIADNVQDKTQEVLNQKVWRREGNENALWIILDYGNVAIHVFQTESRSFYKLEDLWADAELVNYPGS